MNSENKNITPRFFQIEKDSYKQLVKNFNASDFSNSFTRYSAQLNLLKKLQEDAEMLNLKDEIKELKLEEQKINEALKKLNIEIKL